MLYEPFHNLVPQRGVCVHEIFGVLIRTRGATFNEVTRHGKWCTCKCKKGHIEFFHQDAHSVGHVFNIGEIKWTQSRKIGTCAQWMLGDRACTWGNVNTESHGMRWNDDVGIQHCGIYAVATHRLQGELGSELWLLDGLQNASFTTNLSVFGQTATGLAHKPHWSVRGRLATCGCKKRISGLTSHRRVTLSALFPLSSANMGLEARHSRACRRMCSN